MKAPIFRIIIAALTLLLMLATCQSCPAEPSAGDTQGTLVTMQAADSSAEESKPRPFELEVGSSYETLNNGYDNWREYYVGASKKIAERSVLYGMYRKTERFRLQDGEISLGGYLPLGPKWSANVEASYSDTHNVLPNWSAYGGVQCNMGKGWGFMVGERQRKYTTTRTNSEHVTLERYFGNFRAAYTFNLSHPQAADAVGGHMLSLSHYYGDRNRITVMYSLGREIESLGNDRLLVMDTHGLNLWGAHWFARDWALTYAAGWHQQDPVYTRNKVQIGIRHQF